MTREIRADYPQLLMFPGSREDWLGPEHPARFIRDLVDSLDLPSRGLRVRATQVGQPPEARRQDASAQWQRSSGTRTPNF